MAFTPNGTIWLCSVPFDNTYKHQYQFFNKTSRDNILLNKYMRDTLTDYVTIREPLRGGGERSKLRAGRNIDDLRTRGINYMVYCNEHHGPRKFFAFITDLIYVNENMTEIEFETDVFQTWFYDCEIKPSFVVREHSETDEVGDNLIPEPFNFSDYEYHNIGDVIELQNFGWLVVSSEPLISAVGRGGLMSGNYQGLYFYFCGQASHFESLFEALEGLAGDCILNITSIPYFCLVNSSVGIEDNTTKGVTKYTTGQVFESTAPANLLHVIDLRARADSFGGYSPKNNKLYTAPFRKLVVNNKAGNEAEYCIEDFIDPSQPAFRIRGDISVTPKVTAFPVDYKGIADAYEFGISLADFPQCSFNNDAFKIWMNKNKASLSLGVANAVVDIGTGIAMKDVGSGRSGVTNYLNIMASVDRAKKEPNIAHTGDPSNNLLTTLGFNNFHFYIRMIKRDYAEAVDSYFTLYGYQVNKIKTPHLCAKRSTYCYLETNDINIIGGIPNDDMSKLKSIFNNGITLWRSHATIGDYSVDNTCVLG